MLPSPKPQLTPSAKQGESPATLKRQKSGHKIYNTAVSTEEVKPSSISPTKASKPSRCRRCCRLLFPYTGLGWCYFFIIAVVLVLALRYTVDAWNAVLSGLVGPSFAYDMQPHIRAALKSGDWEKVHDAYNANIFLTSSSILIGSAESSFDDGGLMASRGGVDDVSVTIDQKLPLASGSKWIGGTTVYAVIDHPLTNLTVNSRPSEYFSFWNCSSPNDVLCQNITIEKLLAFRSGLPNHICGRSHSGISWEECVETIYNGGNYNPERFDTFEYGPAGLAVAGLMALKEMQKLPGYKDAKWDDIFKDLVLDKANITDAPGWDQKFYNNGKMTYDYQFVSHSGTPDDLDFPDLSASLGCSPRQYAQFADAFMSGKLISKSSMQSMTRSHGETPMFYGFDLESFQGYGQTMWYAGRNISHSVGFYGFFPWVDQSDPDPRYHFYGVIAVNYRVQCFWIMGLVVVYVTPFLLIGVGVSAFCAYQDRALRLSKDKETKGEADIQNVQNLTYRV